MLLGNSTTPLLKTTVLAPSGPSAPGPQSFDNNQLSPPTTIVARDLAVAVDPAPGPNTSWTFLLLGDFALTGVQCTIAGADTECTSGSATGTIDPGRELVLQAVATGTPAPTTVSFGWRATTP